MKLWFKYAAGMLFGAALFAVCPKALLETGGIVASLAEICLRIGYYVFAALLYVNVPLGVLKLLEEKKFWRVSFKSAAFHIVSLFGATAIGIVAAIIALPVRVPLLSDTSSQAPQALGAGLISIFPQDLGSVFLNAGTAIAPALVFFFILGLAVSYDPLASRPAVDLADSLSRILYAVNTFITEIVAVLLIPISARSLQIFSASLSSGVYGSFLLILGAAALVLAAVVVPLAAYLLSGRTNPLPLLYSSLPAALAAMASGSLRFSSGTTIRQTGENLGIKRRCSAVTLPFGLIFGRAGTAFVASLSFVIILSSYSQLAISLPSLILILFLIPATTIAASASISNGPLVALTLACGIFGRGFENGYLVMVPVAALLSSLAVFMDALWIGASQALAARRDIPRDMKGSAHFI